MNIVSYIVIIAISIIFTLIVGFVLNKTVVYPSFEQLIKLHGQDTTQLVYKLTNMMSIYMMTIISFLLAYLVTIIILFFLVKQYYNDIREQNCK